MFLKARLKLTAWYLLIIMLVSLIFSAIIYRGLINEVERFERMQRTRFERRLEIRGPFKPLPVNAELIEEVKKRILIRLFLINSGILILAGTLGYFLAGQTLQPIKQMVEEQNRFISDASHELRTPLTALKSAFEVFLRDKRVNVSQARNLIKESLTDINKLQALTDSLLKLAQYQKPQNHLKLTKVNLNQVINQAIRKVKPLTIRKAIKIKATLQPVTVMGNNFSLLDLLVILLDNAIKYSFKNSQITINLTTTNKHALVSITNVGPGIAPKDLPYIFNRFYQADTARSKQNGNGYGLGLAIAKEIVDLHRGSIEVKSTPGEQTTFVVKLPC